MRIRVVNELTKEKTVNNRNNTNCFLFLKNFFKKEKKNKIAPNKIESDKPQNIKDSKNEILSQNDEQNAVKNKGKNLRNMGGRKSSRREKGFRRGILKNRINSKKKTSPRLDNSKNENNKIDIFSLSRIKEQDYKSEMDFEKDESFVAPIKNNHLKPQNCFDNDQE